ncbi:MAG: helix-turn-helix domain-containing protein [Dethiosulfatibacter sp.]|nr:helix-turn-helix domain-containing protein [Dethiosulfatibacter sp.]
MARMRTIKQTMKYLKEKDPNTSITEWWLRSMLRSGELRSHKAGNKYLVNLDYLEEYFNDLSENAVTKISENKQ